MTVRVRERLVRDLGAARSTRATRPTAHRGIRRAAGPVSSSGRCSVCISCPSRRGRGVAAPCPTRRKRFRRRRLPSPADAATRGAATGRAGRIGSGLKPVAFQPRIRDHGQRITAPESNWHGKWRRSCMCRSSICLDPGSAARLTALAIARRRVAADQAGERAKQFALRRCEQIAAHFLDLQLDSCERRSLDLRARPKRG